MASDAHSTTSSEKMLALYSLLLLTSREWSLTEIADYLQCSKPTALRLLTKIECYEGIRLTTRSRNTAGRPEKCYEIETTTRDVKKTHISVSVEEMRILHLCRDIARPLLPQKAQNTMDAALLHTSVLVPSEENWREPQWPQLRMAMLGTIDYSPFQQTLNILLNSIEKKYVCQITYKAQGRPPRVHEMAITELCGSRQALYAKGWRVQEKGIAAPLHPLFLAVHRIEEIIPTRRTHHILPAKDNTQHFGLIEENHFDVKVFFVSELETYIRERLFSAKQSIESVAGGIELTFTAHSDMEVSAWILSFGSKATVIEPIWMTHRIREELEAMQKNYQSDTDP